MNHTAVLFVQSHLLHNYFHTCARVREFEFRGIPFVFESVEVCRTSMDRCCPLADQAGSPSRGDFEVPGGFLVFKRIFLMGKTLARKYFLPPKNRSRSCEDIFHCQRIAPAVAKIFLPPKNRSCSCEDIFSLPKNCSRLHKNIFLPPKNTSRLRENIFLPPKKRSRS